MRNTGIFIIIIGIALIILLTGFTSFKINLEKFAIIQNEMQNFNWFVLIGPIVLCTGALLLGRSSEINPEIIRHFEPRHRGKF